ncbi:Dynactin subunit 4 [Clonorchis sinensis]|uniref:Dynactin subunit 4 n=1 Tax=Clonorchis sinensis TaxID=79923 RepID=A0A419PK52_CLOSI|nr:Dynactin subunit 4 [Clonorchis sinensis]
MTTYMELDRCQFLCSCRRTSSLFRLYFCRHCLAVRCANCVSHEVDSHYCPNCLENMASAEAKIRKHRCGNCFDCPSCGHTLSTRATATMLPKPDDPSKTMAQKAYYLTCSFCRWSTRDSGIPDQRQSTGGWQETPNPHAKRIAELIDSYHHLAVKEKADREWSKFVRKRNYMILLERYPVLNPRLRRYCSSSWTTPNREAEPAKKVNIPAAEAPEGPVTFDLNPYINQPLQLEKITTIRQRHLAPQVQPKLTAQLQPHPKCLVVKRSMRCRTCEHNLSKADFNPSSIKFRINLSAMYHVPELRFILPPPSTGAADVQAVPPPQRRTSSTWSALSSGRLVHYDYAPGKTQQITLTICNPAHRVTTVTLQQLTPEEEACYLGHLVLGSESTDMSPKTASDACGAGIQDNTPVVGSAGDTNSDGPKDPCFSTVKLTLPPGEIKLAARNAMAEYDENLPASLSAEGQTDPKVIAFRRGNKVGINVGMTPLSNVRFPRSKLSLAPVFEEGQEDTPPISLEHSLAPLRAAVRLQFDYKNVTTSLLSEQRAAAAA